MPDDSNIILDSQTTQDQTGDQDGTGETDQTQNDNSQIDTTEQKGGPSDEMKMQRLEKELAEAREQRDKYKSAYDGNVSSDNSDDGEIDQERDNFYREKAADSVTRELSAEIDKLPKAIKERIEKDPFNSAWTDPKVLEYELIGTDLNNPKEKFEAAKRAAIKSIPHFIESVVTTTTTEDSKKSIGNNPAVDQSKGAVAGRDVWDLVNNDPEEAARLVNNY